MEAQQTASETTKENEKALTFFCNETVALAIRSEGDSLIFVPKTERRITGNRQVRFQLVADASSLRV